MTLTRNELQAAARKRHQALLRKQRDPRFEKVMGRFVAAKLLTTNIEGIRPHDKPVPLEDALWAGMDLGCEEARVKRPLGGIDIRENRRRRARGV